MAVKGPTLTLRTEPQAGPTTPLLGVLPPEDGLEPGGPEEPTAKRPSTWAVTSILSTLLVGVFVANVDMTLLLATYPQVSSDFGALAYGSWLLTAYMLSMCAVQPLYGKLSSIFGRKPMIMLSYVLYATGSAVCGLGQSIWQVIAGRAIAGAGGAGMVCLVSIIITDLVPLREVAAYRSYVNVIQTIGRSIGAPIGGLVADRFGWRATFGLQFPLTIVGLIVVAWKLEIHSAGMQSSKQSPGIWKSLKRVDFVGSFLIAFAVISTLLVFTLAGDKLPWTHPALPALAAAALAGGAVFYLWETHYAAEPIFPPSLLAYRAVWTSYLLFLLQNAAQATATLSVPLFFQVTLNAQAGEAGLYLLPSVFGNTVGGLGTGWYIKRTGRYKLAGVVSGVFGVLGYVLMAIRWSAEPSFSPFWESMYILFAGFATGTAHSAGFVTLTAGLSAIDGGTDESSANIAVAGSGIYLSGNIGGVVGLCLSSALLQMVLRKELLASLDPETAKKAMESISYVQHLAKDSALRKIIVSAYVNGFRYTFWEAAICSALSIVVGICVREHRLFD
ncbi:major facilitator superfamily domain-containing protein [Coniochaeta sp. 2T2.1]|nr:major facilitator superfamily domain-containing protein [Coniochaeta sp. 2T2.1]